MKVSKRTGYKSYRKYESDRENSNRPQKLQKKHAQTETLKEEPNAIRAREQSATDKQKKKVRKGRNIAMNVTKKSRKGQKVSCELLLRYVTQTAVWWPNNLPCGFTPTKRSELLLNYLFLPLSVCHCVNHS